MGNMFSKFWNDMVRPILGRPNRFQVAALCCRTGDAGLEVLVITSRDTGRWILPKGWPIDGLTAPDAALQEAWEEAGVTEARITRDPLGSYGYLKRMEGGAPVQVDVNVYRVDVAGLSDDFPEAGARRREWVSPVEAAARVDEPGLKAILTAL